MDRNKITIDDIVPNSIAHDVGIEQGDKLIKVNGEYVGDILEYKYLITDEFILLEIEKPNAEIWEIEIEKEYDEDIGLKFDGIIDEQKTCNNKCIFCFIDQLPKGMRKTLYFKDDDTRLSFLQGNFVTLTNLKEEDIDRIVKYRISPINISIHTTDMELRKSILNNKNADNLLYYLKKLKYGNINMKGQVVLCPDINDKDQLSKTVNDLYEFHPELSCLAVVPVGLTRYREGLYPLREFDEKEAKIVIEQIESMQTIFLNKKASRFVFLSDEFYIIAQKPLPIYDDYEGFPQVGNGVGLIRIFQSEIERSLIEIESGEEKNYYGTILTSEYGARFIKEASIKIMDKFPQVKLDIAVIKNRFFGHLIKVSGLITGIDIISQLKDRKTCNTVFIPDNMLRSNEEIFLDDMTISDLSERLGKRIVVCRQDGSDLLKNIFEYSI